MPVLHKFPLHSSDHFTHGGFPDSEKGPNFSVGLAMETMGGKGGEFRGYFVLTLSDGGNTQEDAMEGVKQGYQSLSYSKWDCKYHIVFIPQNRRKALFGHVRRHLGEIFHARAQQEECQILEGHLLSDHVHMCIAILPKHP
jgi:hypothetical protein